MTTKRSGLDALRDIIRDASPALDAPEADWLLHELRRDGFVVVTDEQSLWVLPRNKLTPHQVERIREHRDALIRLVQYETPEALRDAEDRVRRLESELASARRFAALANEQIAMLKALLAMRAEPQPIPPDILNALVRLAHPDRHGNSETANRATAWLLQQRGRLDS